jgi:hypothetical protein
MQFSKYAFGLLCDEYMKLPRCEWQSNRLMAHRAGRPKYMLFLVFAGNILGESA